MATLQDGKGERGSTGHNPENANLRYAKADAEELWLTHFDGVARATKIPSELDAVFRMAPAKSGSEYLLRIASDSEGLVTLQAKILEHVALTAPRLPVPRIFRSSAGNAMVTVASGADEQYAALAAAFLPGEPLAVRSPSAALRYRLFQQLAELDRSLETFSHPAARRALLWDVSRSDQAVPFLEGIADPAQRALATDALEAWRVRAAAVLPRLRRQVIHNDFNPSNILVGGDGEITGIIDFGDALDAPLICDLATAIAYQEPDGGFDAVLSEAIDAYGAILPLTAQEIAVLPVLICARAAMVIAIAHRRATQNPDNSTYLLRNVPLAARVLESAARSTARSTNRYE